MNQYDVLIVYGDGTKSGYIVRGDSVTSVTIGAVIHLVDPLRDPLAIGVKLHA